MGEFDEIPGLYRKLRLLIEAGFYKDWDTLGKEFGVSGNAVQGWGHGSLKQRRNWVPKRHHEKLIEVFAKCFPGVHGALQIRSLILGPVRDIEAALSLGEVVSLPQLIKNEGKCDSCGLFPKSSSLGLVETDEAPERDAQFVVDLRASFRLEFETRFHGSYTYALQHFAKEWSPLPSGFDAKSGTIHLPGFGKAGMLICMSEKAQPGHHRFVVLQTLTPVPLSATNALLHDSTLDVRALDELSSFYATQKLTERRIFYVDIRIRKPGHDDKE